MMYTRVGGSMKKNIIIFCLVLILTPVFSLEVDRIELESAGDENSVVFLNYTGPHDIISSAEQIVEIGIGMGAPIDPNVQEVQRMGERNRYYVIHAVDPDTTVGLDADILILGEDALVDHIDNLRRIISGYLQAAYDYSAQDADTLAIFATVYNAVYRGQLDVFEQKYKPIVLENLSQENVGLALSYDEWPGKTQIVIPFVSLTPGTINVDTGVISDSEVIDSLRDEPDMGIDARKDLADIKEEESQVATQAAIDSQRAATEAKEEVEQETEVLEQAQNEAEVAQQIARENPEDEQAQQEAIVAQERVEEQEEVVAQAEQRVEELQQQSEAQQDFADARRVDAQTDRIEIAEDQQEIVQEQLAMGNETIELTHGLKIVDERRLLSSLVLMDVNSGIEVKESSIDVIRNRVIFEEADGYVAIAGTTGRNAAVRLVKLDLLSMEIIQQSLEKLSADSVIVKDNNFYYVVVEDEKNFYVAKYDSNLLQVVQSSLSVQAQTAITITGAGVLVTDEDGLLRLLNTSDLEIVKPQNEEVVTLN